MTINYAEIAKIVDAWASRHVIRKMTPFFRDQLSDLVIAAQFAVKHTGDIHNIKHPDGYYISGPYPDGRLAVCELSTARVVCLFSPGDRPDIGSPPAQHR